MPSATDLWLINETNDVYNWFTTNKWDQGFPQTNTQFIIKVISLIADVWLITEAVCV